MKLQIKEPLLTLIQILKGILKNDVELYMVGDSIRKLIEGKFIKELTFNMKNCDVYEFVIIFIGDLKKNSNIKIIKNVNISKLTSKSYDQMTLYSFSISFQEIIFSFNFRKLYNNDIKEDLLTRDFTFNGLYFNIKTEELFDPSKQGLDDLIEKRIKLINNLEITFEESYNANCRYFRLVKISLEDKTYKIDDIIVNHLKMIDFNNLAINNPQKFLMFVNQVEKMTSLGNPVLIWEFFVEFEIFFLFNIFLEDRQIFREKILQSVEILKNLVNFLKISNYFKSTEEFIIIKENEILNFIFFFPLFFLFENEEKLEMFFSKIIIMKAIEKKNLLKLTKNVTNEMRSFVVNVTDKKKLILCDKKKKVICLNLLCDLNTKKDFIITYLLILISLKKYDLMKSFHHYFLKNSFFFNKLKIKNKIKEIITNKNLLEILNVFWNIQPVYEEIDFLDNSKFIQKKQKKNQIEILQKEIFDLNNKIDLGNIFENNLFFVLKKCLYLLVNSKNESNYKDHFFLERRLHITNYIKSVLLEKITSRTKLN
jgi:hypothetical protein